MFNTKSILSEYLIEIVPLTAMERLKQWHWINNTNEQNDTR